MRDTGKKFEDAPWVYLEGASASVCGVCGNTSQGMIHYPWCAYWRLMQGMHEAAIVMINTTDSWLDKDNEARFKWLAKYREEFSG